MKHEVYKKKLDKKGNPVIVNGDYVTELVSTEGEDDKLTIDQLNEMQYNELQLTDWCFIRKSELGIEVPQEILDERDSIRKKYNYLKANVK